MFVSVKKMTSRKSFFWPPPSILTSFLCVSFLNECHDFFCLFSFRKLIFLKNMIVWLRFTRKTPTSYREQIQKNTTMIKSNIGLCYVNPVQRLKMAVMRPNGKFLFWVAKWKLIISWWALSKAERWKNCPRRVESGTCNSKTLGIIHIYKFVLNSRPVAQMRKGRGLILECNVPKYFEFQ